jgi:trehalose 6-phosphate synthase
MNFDESHWLAYRAVNLTFAQVVLSQVRKGDVVWVQDYHLMLLPLLLRGLIAGKDAGASTRRELKRVIDGIPDGAEEDQGEAPESDRKPQGELREEDVKIGFFLVSLLRRLILEVKGKSAC